MDCVVTLGHRALACHLEIICSSKLVAMATVKL